MVSVGNQVLIGWKCVQLLWEDVSPRQIYTCRDRTCQHQRLTIDGLFNATLSRNVQYCKKPESLPLDKKYVCVDKEIIKAWMMCTT